MEFRVNDLGELNEVALQIVKAIQHPIVLFKAPMGAGKTTLIKSMALALGISDLTNSPTYSIVNEYVFENGKVFHFDLYRINDLEEALAFGVEEYLDSNHYCWIEWPEIISDLLPENHHIIEINLDGNARLISFQ